MSMTATAYGRVMEESAGSSAPFWNHHALRRPVAVSLLLHVSVFAGVLFWWQAEGTPAPRGNPEGFSVTLVDFAEPAPKAPQAPMTQAKPAAAPVQPEQDVKPEPKPQVKPAVVEPKPEPVIPAKPVAELAAKPEPKPEAAQAAQAAPAPQPAAAASPLLQAASLAPSDSETGKGQGAAQGFKDTQGRESDEVYLVEPRFRSPPRPPVYPRRARDLEQEGEALIRVRLDPSGNAAEVLVWKSSGFALLDNAAITAVRGWQFEPARRGGKPVVAWVQIPVRFALN